MKNTNVLENAKNLGESLGLRGVEVIERNLVKGAHIAVSGLYEASKGGVVTNTALKVAVGATAVNFAMDIIENATGVNLDVAQSITESIQEVALGTAVLATTCNFIAGARKASADRTQEIYEELILSKDEKEKIASSSIVLAPLDLEF